MELEKGSRFAKIAGDFGETLFLYWLSKHGFEVATIDHTGIDLLAYHKTSGKRFGISIKTRTRQTGTEKDAVNLKTNEIKKIQEACRYFTALPFVGVVVDRSSGIDCLLISLDDLLEINPAGKTVVAIGMKERHWEKYEALTKCLRVHLKYRVEGTIIV